MNKLKLTKIECISTTSNKQVECNDMAARDLVPSKIDLTFLIWELAVKVIVINFAVICDCH